LQQLQKNNFLQFSNLKKSNNYDCNKTAKQATIFGSADIFESSDASSKQQKIKRRIETIDVNEWRIDDVIDWLSFLRDKDGVRMREHFGEMFMENDINGKVLVDMTDDTLQSLGVKSLGKRMKILNEIQRLKVRRSKYAIPLCLKLFFNCYF